MFSSVAIYVHNDITRLTDKLVTIHFKQNNDTTVNYMYMQYIQPVVLFSS